MAQLAPGPLAAQLAIYLGQPRAWAALAFLRFLGDPAKRGHWEAAGFEPAGGVPG